MAQESASVPTASERINATNMVHALMQFLMAMRYRKSSVAVALVVCLLLGGLYYTTATRYYGATAQLLVLQADMENWTSAMAQHDRMQHTLMSNQRSLVRSAKVIESALERLGPEIRVDLGQTPRRGWVPALQENLSVTNLYDTNILEVTYRSRDPRVAVSVVNAVVDSYIEFVDKTYKGTAAEILDILTREKAQLDEKLARKEAELLHVRQQVVDLGISDNNQVVHPVVQRAVDLNSELSKVQTQRLGLEVSLRQIEAAVLSGADVQQHLLSLSELVGQDMLRYQLGMNTQDAMLQAQLQKSLVEDQAALQSLVEEHGYGLAHPEVLALQQKIHQTQQFLQNYPVILQARTQQLRDGQLGPTVLAMVRQKLAETRNLEIALGQQFQAAQAEAIRLSGQMAQVDILNHEVQWLRNLRDLLLQRITDLNLQQKGRDVRAYVVDDPEANPRPVSPKLLYTLLASIAGGLFLGMAGVYVSDILDDRFRSVDELQAILGLPVLAAVRDMEPREGAGVASLQMYQEPTSAESEAFRTLRTALAFSEQETNMIVVTSPEPSDGKTTVLANLAVAVAQSGKRTLLIDADMRRPGLTAALGLRGTEGLSSVIRAQGDVASEAAARIRPSGLPGLDVLSSGPRPANPAELLGSGRFSELLAWAESTYDQVFIDSPPALATSDTAVIGRITGAVFLVMQPAKNRRRTVIQAVRSFTMLRIPVLGVVLNRVDTQKEGYYGYEYYGYEYDYESDADEDPDAAGELSELSQYGGQPAKTDAPTFAPPREDAIVPRRVA